MALYVYTSGSPLSEVCDRDINKTCLSQNDKMASTPGKVLACLKKSIRNQATSGAPKKAISAECKALVDIAEPPDAMADYNQNLQVRFQFRCVRVGYACSAPCRPQWHSSCCTNDMHGTLKPRQWLPAVRLVSLMLV